MTVTGAVTCVTFVTESRTRRRERRLSPPLLVLDHVDDAGLPLLSALLLISFTVFYTWGSFLLC